MGRKHAVSSIKLMLLFVVPEISAANVTNITQTTVSLSWNYGQTRFIGRIKVYYTVVKNSVDWKNISLPVSGRPTSHTVTSLQPGTRYRFAVRIYSYGKQAQSPVVTVTTGRTRLQWHRNEFESGGTRPAHRAGKIFLLCPSK